MLTQPAVQGALTWLEETQDKPLEELQKAQANQAADEDEDEQGTSIKPLAEGESAKSLICNECGKKFRSPDAASYHATKTSVATLSTLA